MIGTTRSRVSNFMEQIPRPGLHQLQWHHRNQQPQLNVLLHDKPQIKTREAIELAMQRLRIKHDQQVPEWSPAM